MKCAVANCKSTNNSKACEISFFLFPTDAALQKKWLHFCGKGKQINPKTSFVCMLHFSPDDIENSLEYEMGFAKKRLLKRGIVPSIIPEPHESKKLCEERLSIIEKRENKKIVASILQEHNWNRSREQLQENEARGVDERSFFQINQPNLNMENVEHLNAELIL